MKRKRVRCPHGHTNHIVRILYGMAGPEAVEKYKKGLIMLGGCEVTMGQPTHFCKLHDIEIYPEPFSPGNDYPFFDTNSSATSTE